MSTEARRHERGMPSEVPFHLASSGGSKPFWDPISGVFGAPPMLEPILVGIGIFTGGTIWILSHGHLGTPSRHDVRHGRGLDRFA